MRKSVFLTLMLVILLVLAASVSVFPSVAGTMLKGAAIVSKSFADDAAKLVFKYGDDLSKLIYKYGDDAVKIAKTYGKKSVEVLKVYGDEAMKVFKDYGDDGVKFFIWNSENVSRGLGKYGDDALKAYMYYGDTAVKAVGKYSDDILIPLSKSSSISKNLILNKGDELIKISREFTGNAEFKHAIEAAGNDPKIIEIISKYGKRILEYIKKNPKTIGAVGLSTAIFKVATSDQLLGKAIEGTSDVAGKLISNITTPSINNPASWGLAIIIVIIPLLLIRKYSKRKRVKNKTPLKLFKK